MAKMLPLCPSPPASGAATGFSLDTQPGLKYCYTIQSTCIKGWRRRFCPHANPCGGNIVRGRAVLDYAVGEAPNAIVVGDFNGDGRLDQAASNWISGTVSVLLNQLPQGTFQACLAREAGSADYSLNVEGPQAAEARIPRNEVFMGNLSAVHASDCYVVGYRSDPFTPKLYPVKPSRQNPAPPQRSRR
jgi:hypothetical protein